jgi:hypothetical protein
LGTRHPPERPDETRILDLGCRFPSFLHATFSLIPIAVPTFGSYLRYVTAPFFRAWWAVITGLASVLSLYIAHTWQITLTAPFATTLTFIVLTMGFLVISVVARGWDLFVAARTGLKVTSFERSRDVEEGWILVIEGNMDLSVGAVIDIHKRAGAAEVPLALVQVTGKNSNGSYQATPIGRINPAHVREHSAGALRPSDLVVRPFVEMRRMTEVMNGIA